MFSLSKRVSLKEINSVFVSLPDGIGDLIYWLPVLRIIFRQKKNLLVRLPIDCQKFLPLCGAEAFGVAEVHFIQPSEEELSDLSVLLNDNKESLEIFGPYIYRSQIRVGLPGGQYRKNFLTHAPMKLLFKKPKHELDRNKQLLNVFNLNLDNSNIAELLSISRLAQNKEICDLKKYVVLHPYSRGHGREWPISSFLDLAERFIDDGYTVVLTGSLSEREKIENDHPCFLSKKGVVNLFGKLSLSGLLVLLKEAQIVIAASTGPVHLAASLGVRTLGLYPPRKGLNPKRWGPVGKNALALSLRKCDQKSCANDACECMQRLSVDDIFKFAKCYMNDEPQVVPSVSEHTVFDVWRFR